MKITEKEMQFILTLAKNPREKYNANSIAKRLNMSAMGALKIARKLGKEGIVNGETLGRARFYDINIKNLYVQQYLKFLIQREAEHAHPYVRMWITDLRKIKHAESIIIFGSVLRKHEDAKDIDVLFVVSQKEFSKLKKEIEEINLVSDKKIHPIYQSSEDVIANIKKEDPVILNAIKGIIIKGEDLVLRVLK